MQSTSDSVDSLQSGGRLTTGGPKLSLVAQFDDMCRFANSLITVDEHSLIDLIRKCEENRIRWLSTKRELIEMKNRCEELTEQNKELESNLKHVRFGYGKEVQNREDLIKQRNALLHQLNAIKEFVLSETPISQNQVTREKVLSFMNLNQLETVKEDNESLDGVEYDVSEDNVLMDSIANASRRLSKRKSTDVDPNTEKIKYSNRGQTDRGQTYGVESTERLAPKAVFEETIDLDLPTAGDPPRNSLHSNPNPIGNRYGAISKSSPFMSANNRLFSETNAKNLSPLFSVTPLEEKKHNLHQKKAFKQVCCGPCRQPIGFFGTFLCCEDCRAVCHMHCKAKLPMPCIPFRKPNGKSSQMQLIADFAPQIRPMVPALIYHCCNEIEKRGLHEEGIYRKCGNDKLVGETKEKILKSKTGMPVLGHYDIDVLCGVIRRFLRDLDEPIVTRILWRDFVRASDQENPDQEKALIMQTVEELPTANRDSLAFIMVHLNRVAQADANLMDTRALAKIFGPTIVGHSMIDPPMTEILAESPKQIKVMEALFRIPEEYWNGILTTTNSWEPNRYNNSPDRRYTSNGRLGNVQRGTLTPLRSTHSKGGLTLKPLF